MVAGVKGVGEEVAYTADCVVNAGEVVGYCFRDEEVVAILAVGEVVV